MVCALAAELRGFRARDGVCIIEAGVGPVEASIVTARALAEGAYSAVLSAGIAGAFRGRGRIGEAVLVAGERLAGLDREDGSALTLPDGGTVCDRIGSSPVLMERCAPLGLRSARGLTVTTVTSTDATAARLMARYDCDVETMEGFAVLRAAKAFEVPALELRGISNYAGNRESSEWNFAAGRDALAAVFDGVLDRIGSASPLRKTDA